MPLAVELAFSTVFVLATVVFHGTGLLAIGRLLRAIDPGDENGLNPLSWIGTIYTCIVTLGLLVLAGCEIWFYAGIYTIIGAIPTLRESVYFSTITYAAIGFSDNAISDAWKVLGAIEGINGVLLLGWSVAFLVTQLRRIRS